MSKLVTSPDVVVRFVGGQTVVHVGPKVVFPEGPLPLLILARFARPTTLEDALAVLPPAGHAAAREAVSRLREAGVLLVAEEDHTDRADDAEAAVEHAGKVLAILADTVPRIAGGLAGLGPFAAPALAERTGVGLRGRVASLAAAATALEAELVGLRHHHVERQLQALGVGAETRALKLNLGCGEKPLPGWINVDAHPAPLSIDLRWGLPFADGAAGHVFLSHVLEHLYYPDEALALLREVRRVLGSGGCLRVVVPDIEQCLAAYTHEDREFFADRRKTFTWWPESETRLEGFLAYAGAGPRPSHFMEAHKFGYDFETLSHVLRKAGFEHVERSGFMASADPVFRVDEASLVAGATSGESHYSLFVEAR
jgi:hypothetical protein